MSFLNLGKRLQPAKKAWKTFTSKLHTKLHKLNTSKAIKKPKTRPKTTITKPLPWPALIFQPRLRRRQWRSQTTHLLLRCNRIQTRSAPLVYIDELFPEPVSGLQKESWRPPATGAAKGKGLVTEKCPTGLEMAKLPNWHADDAPGPSKEGGEGQDDEKCVMVVGEAADEMWESLGMASPLTRGINERAEEFITRIRAEMQLQEMMARQDDEKCVMVVGEAADEMWESLGMASPLTRGINERAEEFITRIRAEMQLQEMMARRL